MDTDTRVSTVGEEKLLSERLILRQFKVERTDLDQSLSVTQLHFAGWPDHGAPSDSTSVASLALMLEHTLNHLVTAPSAEKVLVHCSAGIGRTGTTICLVHCLMHLWAQRRLGVS